MCASSSKMFKQMAILEIFLTLFQTTLAFRSPDQTCHLYLRNRCCRVLKQSVADWEDLCPLSSLPRNGSWDIVRPRPEIPVVVAVDNSDHIYVLRDIVPCVGHRLSEWALVDGQVKVVLDQVTRRKYYLADGTVRGERPIKGALVDKSGLAAAAIRFFWRPRPVPLDVLEWRIEEDGSVDTSSNSKRKFVRPVLQIRKDALLPGDQYQGSAYQLLLRRIAVRLLPQDRGGIAVDENKEQTSKETEIEKERIRFDILQLDETVRARSLLWPPSKIPSNLLVRILGRFAQNHHAERRIQKEIMKVIVARRVRDGYELGRSQFKVIGEPLEAARDDIMKTVLDDIFGAENVAVHVRASSDNNGRLVEISVAPLVSLFVEPSERRHGLGDALFRAMLRESRISGYNFALLKAEDNGSGKLIKWYEDMGFHLLPADNPIGLMDGSYMVSMLPVNASDEYYMSYIRNVVDIYDGSPIE